MIRKISRRSAVLALATVGAGNALLGRATGAAPAGYVLRADEGEHLIQRGGNIFIKVDPTRGSAGLAMGTQQILPGVGIPIHRHFQMDEAFYVIGGAGTFDGVFLTGMLAVLLAVSPRPQPPEPATA